MDKHTMDYLKLDSVRFIKKRFPFIPKFVIVRKILYTGEIYMHKMGFVNQYPDLNSWKSKAQS